MQGCDASILLEGPNSEKTAAQNKGLGAFVAIDKIKQVLEHYCPGAVSCADILNLATRDALCLVCIYLKIHLTCNGHNLSLYFFSPVPVLDLQIINNKLKINSEYISQSFN